MPNQSPAPVAGAVNAVRPDDAFERALRLVYAYAEECVTDGHVSTFTEGHVRMVNAITAIEREARAALHPQPAPAVAVEAERELFEAYFAASRRNKGVAKRPTFQRLEDDTYSDDHTQRHWWTWQNALAARSAPAVAEKVPLTVEEIGDLLQDHARYSDEMQDFAREVQSAFAEKNGLRLAGSAQEGQANG